MQRRELQQALKAYREQGLTVIRLNAKTEELQQEFNQIQIKLEIAEIEKECDQEKAIATAEDKAEVQASINEMFAPDFEETNVADTPLHPEVKEVVEPLKDALLGRLEGATNEARMQDVIDRAGLYDELEQAWYLIPDYKHFEPIFSGDAATGMFAELLMSEKEHANYVRVCQEAQRIQTEFTRRALELISQ
ncbi:MAG: hypothetical protein HC836_36930 [Richelia sp. RM2_1_2]|nr:hypothetical protein [Richelia sp. RM2_1_2]